MESQRLELVHDHGRKLLIGERRDVPGELATEGEAHRHLLTGAAPPLCSADWRYNQREHVRGNCRMERGMGSTPRRGPEEEPQGYTPQECPPPEQEARNHPGQVPGQ